MAIFDRARYKSIRARFRLADLTLAVGFMIGMLDDLLVRPGRNSTDPARMVRIVLALAVIGILVDILYRAICVSLYARRVLSPAGATVRHVQIFGAICFICLCIYVIAAVRLPMAAITLICNIVIVIGFLAAQRRSPRRFSEWTAKAEADAL